MSKSYETVKRRREELGVVLDGFTAVNNQIYDNSVGYSYTAGYLNSLLVRVLSENVSEEVFKEITDQLRKQTVDNLARG